MKKKTTRRKECSREEMDRFIYHVCLEMLGKCEQERAGWQGRVGIRQKKRRAEVKPLVGMLSVGDLRSATMLGAFVFCQATGLAGCCRWILEISVCVRAGTEGATRPDMSPNIIT